MYAHRSKTAEDYFSEHFPELIFVSAGTNKKICNQLGTNYVNEQQLEWADKIYVMEQKHYKAIKEAFNTSYSNKINLLNIKDIYKYGAKELIEILILKVNL